MILALVLGLWAALSVSGRALAADVKVVSVDSGLCPPRSTTDTEPMASAQIG